MRAPCGGAFPLMGVRLLFVITPPRAFWDWHRAADAPIYRRFMLRPVGAPSMQAGAIMGDAHAGERFSAD